MKHEAAYFYVDDEGRRCASIVIDMKDSSEMPGLAEPFFWHSAPRYRSGR
jgi:hypothetical protein